ncbi:MAG: hypothetical protein ACXADH_05395 [Candidatus Kariarchaeaceae archaeon]|jgi:hypothetical protein
MKLHNCKYIIATGTTGRYAGCDLLAHPEVNELYCLWNCGFYSNESQVFKSLLILLRHGIIPERIDYSLGYRHFKKDPEQDIYPDFHTIDSTIDLDLYVDVELPDPNRYQPNVYQFDIYNQLRNKFFGPNDLIKERVQYLKNKYSINPEKTISVLYRGTDKGTELSLAHPQEYLFVTQQLLEKNPDFKVLLQTDQTQVIQMFAEVLGDKLIFFEETPSTTSSSVIWNLMERSGADSIDWSQWFDAALRCVSDCKYIVNHTGNVAFFANLYRGSLDGVYQFNEQGVIDLE